MSTWTTQVAQARELYHGTMLDGDAVGWCDHCEARVLAESPVSMRVHEDAPYAPAVLLHCAHCTAEWGPA